MKDDRDPTYLGEVLLENALEDQVSLSRTYDTYFSVPVPVPNYKDETTLEKYGDPRLLPSTLPN